jgi:adenosylhomocysteinase
MSIVRDPSLASEGRRKIDWVKNYMPVLSGLEKEFSGSKPFRGLKMTVCIHLEAKTAYLIEVLQACGARVSAAGSNPLSTQDDIAAALAEDGVEIFATHGCTEEEYNTFLERALEFGPDFVMDDGGDLIAMLHEKRRDLLANVKGSSEETTTGVIRLRTMDKAGKLEIPVIPVNDAECKYLFDNRYGTGQSVWDGIMRTTNLMIAGKRVVIAGYGWCGKGAARKAQGLGARVIVTEVDHRKAIEAIMDGFDVMTMDEASRVGDIFLTLTGCEDVITERHFSNMKSGVLLANAGHFDCEVSVRDLERICISKKELRKNIMGYEMPDGRVLNLLAEGRLVNLASGDGHPAEIMDMSFALQFQALKYLSEHYREMKKGLYQLPYEIDYSVAIKKLAAMGGAVDVLTEKQKEYLYGAQE